MPLLIEYRSRPILSLVATLSLLLVGAGIALLVLPNLNIAPVYMGYLCAAAGIVLLLLCAVLCETLPKYRETKPNE